jgi:signal transduction histidine kinase
MYPADVTSSAEKKSRVRRWPLSTKVVAAYSALIALVVGTVTTGVCWQFRSLQQAVTHDRLLDLLNLVAPQIDSDYHTLIVTSADVNEAYYSISQQQLQAVQLASPSVNRIYTIRQQTDGQLIFVLDSPAAEVQQKITGEPLDIFTPLLEEGELDLPQAIVENKFQVNADGAPVLYGYAPIQDQFGRLDGILAIELDVSEEIRSSRQVGIVALMLFLVILGLTTVLVWGLSGRLIVRPILRLNQAAKQLASGQWQQRLPNDRTDELGELSESFNYMANCLQQSLHQLETYSNKLVERTEQLEDSKEKVESQNLELKEALDTIKSTQMQLIHNEKMSSLGQMVAGIAHEVNNPVNFIHANLRPITQYTQDLLDTVEIYQQHYPNLNPDIQAHLDAIEIDFITEDLPRLLGSMELGSTRIKEIILSLRNFSRLDETACKAANIHEGIDSTLVILRHRLREATHQPKIEIVKNYDSLPSIECHPSQLNQVFMNVLSNAVEALRESNQVSPKIEITTLQKECKVYIYFRDNGPGIPQEIKNKIFDPFFTTKPVGSGTGLGMSISSKYRTKVAVFDESHLSRGVRD